MKKPTRFSQIALVMLSLASVERAQAQPSNAEQESNPPSDEQEPRQSDAQQAAPDETSADVGSVHSAPSAEASEPESKANEAPSFDIEEFRTRLEELAEENQDLRDEVELLREDLSFTDEQVKTLLPIKARLSGYSDLGFFHADGDGSGIRSDIGNFFFPEYAGRVADSWVFMGDPLATMINSRGDPAETSDSRALVFDGVGSNGKSTFLVNAFNLQFFTGVGDSLSLASSIDFVPRDRNISDPDGNFLGDYIDVKLAYLEYRAPWEALKVNFYAGKFDSVVGREYRAQESPQRISVTPSLICRYVCGRPIGLKARLAMLEDSITLTASVTNGSHFWRSFPFSDESDSNEFKTLAGRLAYELPMVDAEVGVSGSFGAQDQQPENDVYQWHVGVDATATIADVTLVGEYVQGEAEGKSEADPTAARCGIAQCLEYKGAYGLVSYRFNNFLIPYARGGWRKALHQAGASFVYISNLARITVGLRSEIGTHLIVKGEYIVNRELGRVPEFNDDVFASSLILKY